MAENGGTFVTLRGQSVAATCEHGLSLILGHGPAESCSICGAPTVIRPGRPETVAGTVRHEWEPTPWRWVVPCDHPTYLPGSLSGTFPPYCSRCRQPMPEWVPPFTEDPGWDDPSLFPAAPDPPEKWQPYRTRTNPAIRWKLEPKIPVNLPRIRAWWKFWHNG